MKSPVFQGLLLVLNLVLVAALVYFVHSWPSTPAPEPARPAAPAHPKPAVAKAPAPVVVTNDFRWVQLESEDYRAYINRLRSIGCPEQTIRDLVIADLDKLLAPKVQSIYGRRAERHYWDSEEEELANNYDPRELTRQERDVDNEKRQIIQELLGVDVVRERLKQRGFEDYYERRLSFLPEEKRGPVRMIMERYDDLEQQIRAKQTEEGEALTPQDQAQLQSLREQRQAELAGTLSPAEKEQYELWMSPSADAARFALYGMGATEQEFQAVYKLRRAFDEKWNPEQVTASDDATLLAWQQAREQLDAQIREQLGDQRYADYKRGEDPDFHHLNAVVSRYKLARNKANDAYEVKRTAQQMSTTIRADASLTPAQRDEALKAIAAETELTLRQMLGNSAYRFFQQRSQMNWVGN